MTRYANLKDQPKKFLSLTGCTLEGFSVLLPWIISTAFAVLILLLIGVGTQFFGAVAADETEITTPEPQWTQTRGPEGGRVVDFFATTFGDIYAGTAAGLYRLTAGQRAWQLITSDAPEAFTVYNEIGWWPITARRDTLYFATDTKVLASMDQGETWNVLGTHPKGLPIGIAITDSGLGGDIAIYLALATGIFRSEGCWEIVDAPERWFGAKENSCPCRSRKYHICGDRRWTLPT